MLWYPALILFFLGSCASVPGSEPTSEPALRPAQEVTSPERHLGRPLGRDFELADWDEVSGYFRRLGAESPRVRVETVGTTTEGRDFLLAVISSEENLANEASLRQANRRLADPRGLTADERTRLLATARPTVFLSIAMHSTETAAPQFGMEFAYRLATSTEEPFRSARENCLILMAPCLNPDGLDHVVSWYRETVGTPFEASGLLKLYQLYAGHDNNRDWFMLSQNESRIITRLLYSEWFPQVYWDVHQQGQSSERFFVPPYRDPLNPNLDPAVIAGIDQLGTRALFDMTRAGLTGISTGVTYDMWWNGGNRNVPVRHNILGLLTEAASVNLASPVFLPASQLSAPGGLGEYAPSNRFPAPWPGGWWRLRDIIDYEHAFGRSLVGSLAREPELWLGNALAAAERAIEKGQSDAPRGWVIPSTNPDRGAVARLVDTLLLGGVELERATADFQADGRTWPAGSIVIRRGQPYGQHVKDLFEVQRYPDGDPPYDVAGWTLPFLLGVRRVEVLGEFEVETRPVSDVAQAVEAFASGAVGSDLDPRDSDAWKRAFAHLGAGGAVALTDGRLELDPEPREDGTYVSVVPRIGLYAPWSGSMDEGWARYALDSFGVPYVGVRNEMIRAGELDEFLDVLVIASVSGRQLDRGRAPGSVPPEFTRGLEPEGVAAIEAFVRRGGRLICLGSSSSWALEVFDLPLKDVTRGDEAKDFSCPGSVLRAVPAEEHPLTAGLPASTALFFSRSSAFEPKDKQAEVEVLLRYAPTRVLLSGWIRSPEVIEGKGAWVRAAHGAGSVHLFGFRPQYRGWSQATFRLLFRAMLFG